MLLLDELRALLAVLGFEQRAPEHGERVRVARVECDLVNLQRSIFAVRHGFQRTTCCVHCRIEIRSPLPGDLHGLSAHARCARDALGRTTGRTPPISVQIRSPIAENQQVSASRLPQVHDREPTQV
jgi:hypothetical protein